MPAYNAEPWIAEAIASVLEQTLPDLELIIVDDGSTDRTTEIIQSFNDARIHLISKTNGGVSTARNAGLDQATGDHITFLDADDRMTLDNLQIKTDALGQAHVDWVFSDIRKCDAHMRSIGVEQGTDGDVIRTILSGRGTGVPGISSNILTHRRCFDPGLRFDPLLSNSADQDIVIGLARGFKYKHVPVPLNHYRTLPGSMSRNIALFEKDLLYFFKKAGDSGLLDDRAFRRYCMGNAYWSIGGSWWKNAGKPLKALPYFLKALLLRPALLFRPFRRNKISGKRVQ